MNTQRLALVFAALIGTPALAAFLLSLPLSTPAAVAACLVLAASGIVGAIASFRHLAR